MTFTQTKKRNSLDARSGSRAGYTVAEVMVAISLFAIGGSGVIAMETTAIRGNDVARRLDQASIVGNGYIDGIQKGVLTWVKPPGGAVPAPPAIFPAIDSGTWSAGSATGYDINGLQTASRIIFCVQHQDTSLQKIGGIPSVLRSDVVVYWKMNRDTFVTCAAPPGPADPLYHYLYLTTVSKVQTP